MNDTPTPAPITISRDLLEQCYTHGAGAYPEEGCGVLSGPTEGDGVDQWHPIANVLNQMHADDPERYPRTGKDGYFMDPAEMMRLERSLSKAGRKVKVIVHSHVDVGAYFSQEDKTRALWAGEPMLPGMLYLVCGIKDHKPDGAILAWWDDTARDFATAQVDAPQG